MSYLLLEISIPSLAASFLEDLLGWLETVYHLSVSQRQIILESLYPVVIPLEDRIPGPQ